MDVPPLVVERGQTAPLLEFKGALIRQMEDSFELGFGAHAARREGILWQINRLLSLENIRHALFPPRPLRRADISTQAPRIKADEVEREELLRWGIIPGYDASTHLYISLYVLPAPVSFARRASSRPEEYARTRPYMRESRLCTLPHGESAYYVVVGAFGMTGSMVVRVKNEGPVGAYHLEKECQDKHRRTLRTRDVRSLDGMKIYRPVQIREGDRVYDRTFVLSATVSAWEGFKGWLKNRASNEHHATVYGEGGASEILAVIGKSQRQNPTEVTSHQNGHPHP